jgi:riboflavin synthase
LIIPHTEASTNIKHKKVGDKVNLENDMIGKYIEKYAHRQSQKKEKNRGISNEFLAEHGFV